jgi:hypothetical protein
MAEHILAIVGYRHFHDYDFVKSKLEGLSLPPLKKVISGGASGVDRLAELWATEHGVTFKEYPANWQEYGRKAGPIRNTIISKECHILVAFPSKYSRGTYDVIGKARRNKKVVYVFEVPE